MARNHFGLVGWGQLGYCDAMLGEVSSGLGLARNHYGSFRFDALRSGRLCLVPVRFVLVRNNYGAVRYVGTRMGKFRFAGL